MLRRPGLTWPRALALCASGTAAEAAPHLDPIFTNHAVLQRDQPMTITGTADRGERLSVTLAGRSASATADRSGRWSARLAALSAGGPYRVEVRGAAATKASAEDIMIGDVWLCSGQSNMEYPLSRARNGAGEVEAASDKGLRLMTIAQRAIVQPQQLAADTHWDMSNPKTAADFSAACIFMARSLRVRAKDVAIGLIDSTWGGTPISAWMDVAAVRSSGGVAEADLVALYRRDPAAAAARFGEQWGDWWRSRSGDAGGTEPWRASDQLSWQPLPSFSYWEGWDLPQFAQFNGGAWARKRVQLTAAQASSAATLELGVVDDSDTTFVNGDVVGTTYSWSLPRSYKLKSGALKAGDNEILVFIRDNWSNGGFQGPAERVRLTFANGEILPLGSDWQISIAPDRIGEPPIAPWDGQSGVGTLYSGMIEPLGAIGLAGVAWYQGEADVGKAGYARRLGALMSNWRQQFGNPQLPFLIVGLAGWGKPVTAPAESGWAALIDEQRRAVAADDSAALVSAIDLGEWNDIHPANKQEVGRRLALAAQTLVYRDPKGRLGPLPLSVSAEGNTLRIRLSKALKAVGGTANGFELCKAAVGSCRFVPAEVQGSDILIRNVLPEDVRVRHAWADFPIVNLYDADLLPLPVFELPIG